MILKYTIMVLFILHLTILFSDTIIDTLYSMPNLDGDIHHNIDNNTYFANASGWRLYCGDSGFSSFGSMRGFISFSLPDIPEGYELQNAEIFIHQIHSAGNGSGVQFPIWDIIPVPDTTGCVVDHIDYGNQLDEEDWTAGDLGNSQTLQSNIGVISDNASLGFKNLEVTTNVQEDYDTERDKTQYRLRFMINNDWDQYNDYLKFYTSNSLYMPYIICTWWDGQNGVNDNLISTTKFQLNAYPNPFNPETNIVFNLLEEGKVQLDIFNINGQKIRSLLIEQKQAGEHSIVWNGEDAYGKRVSSGVYLYKLAVNDKSELVKKCVLLK